MNEFDYPLSPESPAVERSAGSKGWAIFAAILSCAIIFIFVFFISYFSSHIGIQKLYLELYFDSYDGKVFSIIHKLSSIFYITLWILLGISVIKMTKNKAGTTAGVILIILYSYSLIISLLGLINIINNNEFINWGWLNTMEFGIIQSIVLNLCMIIFGILLGKAVRGVAGKILMIGYFLLYIGVLVCDIYFNLLWEHYIQNDNEQLMNKIDTISIIDSCISLLFFVVITIGYFINIGNYSKRPHAYGRRTQSEQTQLL